VRSRCGVTRTTSSKLGADLFWSVVPTPGYPLMSRTSSTGDRARDQRTAVRPRLQLEAHSGSSERRYSARSIADCGREVSNTFWKPVTHNTLFVAQDSRAKRTALSQQAVQIFYLKNVTHQNESSDVQTAIRNLLTLVKECKDGLPTPGEPFDVAPLA